MTSGTQPNTPPLSLSPARLYTNMPRWKEDMSDRRIDRAYLQNSNCTFRTGSSTGRWREKLERTGGRAPAHVWSQFGTDGWRMTSKTRLWTWQAATATVFEFSSHFFFFFFYQDFMVHLRVFLFIYFFFLQHQEYDLAVHLHADMVTLAGLLWMLIYMGCAFSWAPDDIPHGSRWY